MAVYNVDENLTPVLLSAMHLCLTSGSAARHPSLYLALRDRPWLRMSQSYDLSDVDTTLMLFAAATSLGSELAGTLLCGL